jgi:hypothetical protein
MRRLQVDWLNTLYSYTAFRLLEKLAFVVGWLAGGDGHVVPLNAMGLAVASGRASLRDASGLATFLNLSVNRPWLRIHSMTALGR